ncbi:MAG: GNAT family N-acetyltransferase, partial [Myxococcota bacterium]|nr:GNAT family N-acetyltransferase [Myxococcota bacterium]
YQMWVAPDARRSGLGAALLDAVVAWARREGVRELSLAVSLVNEPARRLYERAGFVPCGEHALRPGSSLRAQDMRLALRPR